jgi:hypothetical protein
LRGKQAAHICRWLEEMPNFLFPKIKSAGTNKPINGPTTYHGHGFLKASIQFKVDVDKNTK